MSKDVKKDSSISKKTTLKLSGVEKAQNGVNVPRRKPEEYKDLTKPNK